MKVIDNFINLNITEDEIKQYNELYASNNIVNIKNCVSEEVLQNVRHEIENYPWWFYFITPNNYIWNPEKYQNLSDEILKDRFNECNIHLENKNFTYRFKRDFADHYCDCECISCRLRETIKGSQVTEFLSKIVGCQNVTPGEIFLSNYGKDDFLSIHHDSGKGDIAVTFSFSYDWYPCYGGILNFCDGENNISRSFVPNAGSLNIFKVDKQNGTKHFVSTVNVNKNRYTLTAWYNMA